VEFILHLNLVELIPTRGT